MAKKINSSGRHIFYIAFRRPAFCPAAMAACSHRTRDEGQASIFDRPRVFIIKCIKLKLNITNEEG